MNTLAIAELTGKRHDHVLRDADKMLKDLGLGGDPKFGASYLTSQNKQARCLNLPYNLTITLVAGYDAVLRRRVIDEWIVLREMIGKPAPGAPAGLKRSDACGNSRTIDAPRRGNEHLEGEVAALKDRPAPSHDGSCDVENWMNLVAFKWHDCGPRFAARGATRRR